MNNSLSAKIELGYFCLRLNFTKLIVQILFQLIVEQQSRSIFGVPNYKKEHNVLYTKLKLSISGFRKVMVLRPQLREIFVI